MPVDPKTSAGARTERKAFRDYLRRRLKLAQAAPLPRSAVSEAADHLQWILRRQVTYVWSPLAPGGPLGASWECPTCGIECMYPDTAEDAGGAPEDR